MKAFFEVDSIQWKRSEWNGVVYFDQQMHACAWVHMVENNENNENNDTQKLVAPQQFHFKSMFLIMRTRGLHTKMSKFT